jgi:hypothetical protein
MWVYRKYGRDECAVWSVGFFAPNENDPGHFCYESVADFPTEFLAAWRCHFLNGGPALIETTRDAGLAADLIGGINALLGLIQLVSHRDDIGFDVRDALLQSHRIDEARDAVEKATGSRPSWSREARAS